MLTDYVNQYYAPQAERSAMLDADNFKVAREIAEWKKNVRREWPSIEVISFTQPESSYTLSPDNVFTAEVVLNIGSLKPEDIGVEMLFATMDNKSKLHIQNRCEFDVAEAKDGIVKYRTSLLPERTGMYQVAARIYPKNPLLPHRQDFGLVRWL